jgi:HKD family nuclease
MLTSFIFHPNAEYRIGDFLVKSFNDPQWTEFRAAIAFVKQSGTKYILNGLASFVERGGKVIITAGIDVGGTTVEALQDLLIALNGKENIFVFHNANSSTFHPKIYLFKNEKNAEVVIGSNNLTEGGLFINYEAAVQISLSLNDPEDIEFLVQIEQALDEWSTAEDGLCYKVTQELIQQLVAENHLPDETFTRTLRAAKILEKKQNKIASIFRARGIRPAPGIEFIKVRPYFESEAEDKVILEAEEEAESLTVEIPTPVNAQLGNNTAFLMTLQKTDVGVGQTTTGAQRRSPEIFIPLICRDFDPEFWGWPDSFVPDPGWSGPLDKNNRGKMDRSNVMIRLGGEIFPVSIWYNPDKRDVRIRSEHIRRAGNIGDILYIERADGSEGCSYYVEIIPQKSVRFDEYIGLCVNTVRNSQKLWGYI